MRGERGERLGRRSSPTHYPAPRTTHRSRSRLCRRARVPLTAHRALLTPLLTDRGTEEPETEVEMALGSLKRFSRRRFAEERREGGEGGETTNGRHRKTTTTTTKSRHSSTDCWGEEGKQRRRKSGRKKGGKKSSPTFARLRGSGSNGLKRTATLALSASSGIHEERRKRERQRERREKRKPLFQITTFKLAHFRRVAATC